MRALGIQMWTKLQGVR